MGSARPGRASTSNVLDGSAYACGVKLRLTTPGEPTQGACIERFTRRVTGWWYP